MGFYLGPELGRGREADPDVLAPFMTEAADVGEDEEASEDS